MVEVTIQGDAAVFRIVGWHKVWAFRSHIRIPLEHIRDVRHEDPRSRFRTGWRVLGTAVPGVIAAGLYRVGGQWIFLDVRKWGKVVVVDLEDERFSQLVLEVQDPAAVVQLLSDHRDHGAG